MPKTTQANKCTANNDITWAQWMQQWELLFVYNSQKNNSTTLYKRQRPKDCTSVEKICWTLDRYNQQWECWEKTSTMKKYYRVSTNLTEQISRSFPEDSRRDFKKNPGHVCIASACYVMYRIYCCDVVCLNIERKHDMHFIQHGAVAKIT